MLLFERWEAGNVSRANLLFEVTDPGLIAPFHCTLRSIRDSSAVTLEGPFEVCSCAEGSWIATACEYALTAAVFKTDFEDHVDDGEITFTSELQKAPGRGSKGAQPC